jgi:hypothetical protein
MISETWENISKDKLNSYIHNNWNACERVLSNCRGRGHSFRHLEQDARIIQIAYSATPESCVFLEWVVSESHPFWADKDKETGLSGDIKKHT